MRATLTTVSTVALLASAAGAGSAAARPADTPMTSTTSTTQQVVAAAAPRGPHTSASRLDAANHALAIHRLNRLDGVASTEAPSAQQAAAPIVHVTRLAGGGFDWADAGIGAGLAAVLLLGAAGVASVRRTPTITAR